MSNVIRVKNSDIENPRFPKPTLIDLGLVGPKVYATAKADGQRVNIPVHHKPKVAQAKLEQIVLDLSPSGQGEKSVE